MAGEAAILNTKTRHFYCLNTVGARIWNLVQQPTTIQKIRDTLVKEYAVESARCETDVLPILQQLQSKCLIETTE